MADEKDFWSDSAEDESEDDPLTISKDAIEHHLPERSGIMGRRERGQIVPFDHIPLVCLYGGDRGGFFQSNPTLFSLAKLNLIHYQVTSDHRQKMHYCCFPSPNKAAANPNPSTGQKHSGRGRFTPARPAWGRQLSTRSTHWAGIASTP